MRGEPGLAYAQVDALGKRLDTHVQRAPVPGATLELTIDLEYQHIVEEALRAGVEASRAKAGTVVMMNPYTGEVLALANYPTFNPNSAWSESEDLLRNRATQDVYEPGSTFKIVTASAAIEEHVVTPTDMIDTNPGSISIPGRRKPITDVHHYGVISFEDVIVKSSNVGAVKVGSRTGATRLAGYVQRFGFGERLAPDFIGASARYLESAEPEREWRCVRVDGLSDWRHAPADGRGRQRRGQRRPGDGTARRACVHSQRQPGSRGAESRSSRDYRRDRRDRDGDDGGRR